jgi:hypothetical protein
MTGKLTLPGRTALVVALSGVVVIAPALAVAAPGSARAATAAPWPVTLTIRTIRRCRTSGSNSMAWR